MCLRWQCYLLRRLYLYQHCIAMIIKVHISRSHCTVSPHTLNFTLTDREKMLVWKSAVFLDEDLQLGRMNAVRIMCPLIGSFVQSSCVIVIKADSSLASPLPFLCTFRAESRHCAWRTHSYTQSGAKFHQPFRVVNEILLKSWLRSTCGIKGDLHSGGRSLLGCSVSVAPVWIVKQFQVFFLTLDVHPIGGH